MKTDNRKYSKWAVILLVLVVLFVPADMCTDCNGRSPCIPDIAQT